VHIYLESICVCIYINRWEIVPARSSAHMNIHIYICIYVYIYLDRQEILDTDWVGRPYEYIHIYVYIYVYTYVYR